MGRIHRSYGSDGQVDNKCPAEMSVLLPPLRLPMPKARAAGGLCAEGAEDEMLCRMWRKSTLLGHLFHQHQDQIRCIQARRTQCEREHWAEDQEQVDIIHGRFLDCSAPAQLTSEIGRRDQHCWMHRGPGPESVESPPTSGATPGNLGNKEPSVTWPVPAWSWDTAHLGWVRVHSCLSPRGPQKLLFTQSFTGGRED